MKYGTTFLPIVASVASLMVLFACGGGGGGGGGSSSGISYSGTTTPVLLSQDNAEQIMEEAVLGVISGSGLLSPLSAVEASRFSGGKNPFLRNFIEVIHDIPAMAAGGRGVAFDPCASAVVTETINEPGSCGGAVTGSLRIDDNTGAATGSITFRDYCEMGLVMNGTVTIDGTVNPYSEAFDLTMTFNSLTEVSEDLGLDVFLSGSIDMISSEYSDNVVMNMYLRDNSSGDTQWLNDYRIYSSYSYDHEQEEMNISGRFYSSDHGYVTLSTEEPLTFYNDDDFPSHGVLLATGAAGTSARLITLSSSTYKVEVDGDGDGVYEYDSSTLYWDE